MSEVKTEEEKRAWLPKADKKKNPPGVEQGLMSIWGRLA